MRILLFLALCCSIMPIHAGDDDPPKAGLWRALPLIENGRIAGGWTHIGWGGFVVEDGSLRTECDAKGMGLLLYEREKLGNCRIRVVYKCKDAKANAGVFVRIDDGILAWKTKKPSAVRRDAAGKLPKEELQKLMDASAAADGAWYPVHHGYEIQICDAADPFHRTGAVYSLAKSSATPAKPPDAWRTMVITLKGDTILVDVDGRRVTAFDPAGKDVPRERQWYEPKREPRRPQTGYVGLQNHDPDDVVWFKEVSVRGLEDR